MIKKTWAVFSFDDSVCGISNEGIVYDDFSFTLRAYHDGIFETKADCYADIEKTMKDYESRKVRKNVRFIALPVFFFDGDKIFDK